MDTAQTSRVGEIRGDGARLGESWEFLPTSMVGIGIDRVNDELLAWCAPKCGRVATLSLPAPGLVDRVGLTTWFIDQGFDQERAIAATTELLSLVHAP